MYSSISDDKLYSVTASMKNDLPYAGYRIIIGRLNSMGDRGKKLQPTCVGLIPWASSQGSSLEMMPMDTTTNKLIKFVLKLS